MHLGKSQDDLIASLGTDYTKVFDENGNEAVAYICEIKDHPKFGDYTLCSVYLFENNACVLQQTEMPVSQLKEMVTQFDVTYVKIADMLWKSKEGTYYSLTIKDQSLHMRVFSTELAERF